MASHMCGRKATECTFQYTRTTGNATPLQRSRWGPCGRFWSHLRSWPGSAPFKAAARLWRAASLSIGTAYNQNLSQKASAAGMGCAFYAQYHPIRGYVIACADPFLQWQLSSLSCGLGAAFHCFSLSLCFQAFWVGSD